MNQKRRHPLLQHIRLESEGLEIGAFDKPYVSKSEGRVLYADVLDTEGMRAKALADGRAVENVQTVDIVVRDGDLPAAVGSRRFDYVLASHVVEHVANPLSWFKQIHMVLRPAGILALAVPDHRFCFDRLRTPTRFADWIEAWLEGRSKPSPGQVFDQLSNTVNLAGAIKWNHTVAADQVVHSGTPHSALATAQRIGTSGDYEDVHCSVFTVATFVHLIRQAIVLGLFDFELVELVPTIEFEFFATFRKQEIPDWAAALASLPIPREGRYASIPADFDVSAYLSLNDDICAARLDPVEHFIDFGRREGRCYRR